MMKGLILLAVLGILVAVVVAGCKATRSGYESPKYAVARKDGSYELRDYPALVVAQTPMNEANGGFMKLFHFITGANEGKQKISMTTPVLMSGNETNRQMAFVMPATARDLPRPSEAGVVLETIPGGRFAALGFRGGRSAVNEAAALEKLRAWLQTQSLRAVATPVFAYYDPPWTPTFLRRNEVLLRLEAGTPSDASPH